jgi:hypothetical protein
MRIAKLLLAAQVQAAQDFRERERKTSTRDTDSQLYQNV